MSEQNVELHRRAVEAFHARNVDAFVACLDPSVEYHSAITVPGGAVYQGHDGVRKYFADFKDAWGDEFRVEPEAYFDLGEQTLMFYLVRGRGQRSGADVAMPGAQVCTWREGLMVYGKAYVNREDALRDLGLSEDALEPITPWDSSDRSNLTLGQFRAAFLAGNEAFNRGDFAAAFAALSPDCEWHSVAYATERLLVGPDQVCRFFQEEIFGMFRGWRSEPVHFLQAGDGIFVVLRSGHGTGSASGAPVHLDLSEVWELRAGVPVRVQEFPTWEEALNVAGLDPSSASELRKAEPSGT